MSEFFQDFFCTRNRTVLVLQKNVNFKALNSERVFLTVNPHCLFYANKFIPLAFFVIDKRY